jgi:hypothetical protein
MSRSTKQRLALSLSVSVFALLVACGGGGHDDGADTPQATAQADVTAAVPSDATSVPSVATSYVAELAAVPVSKSDAIEPVALPEMLAFDDTGEPAPVN